MKDMLLCASEQGMKTNRDAYNTAKALYVFIYASNQKQVGRKHRSAESLPSHDEIEGVKLCLHGELVKDVFSIEEEAFILAVIRFHFEAKGEGGKITNSKLNRAIIINDEGILQVGCDNVTRELAHAQKLSKRLAVDRNSIKGRAGDKIIDDEQQEKELTLESWDHRFRCIANDGFEEAEPRCHKKRVRDYTSLPPDRKTSRTGM